MTTEWSTGWPAPAKLNLMLRIIGRRADGYHELQTVFQFIDLQDSLDFRVRDDGSVNRLSDLPGVAPEQDLVVRAARCLHEHAAAGRSGVDIRVAKRLPQGGGLGGGSSDAATALVALNHLWGCGLSRQALAELGLSLGADVPVFVHGHAAWAEGVGEKIQPIEPEEPIYVVIDPGSVVSTAAIFNDKELTRNSPRITIRAFHDGERINDCVPIVRKHYRAVAQAMDWLETFVPARLTGTGACVFGACGSSEQARAIVAELPGEWRGYVVRGLNRSPLLDRLDQMAVG